MAPSQPISAEARALAERHDQLVNGYVARFDTQVLLLGLELGRAHDERAGRRAIDTFLAALVLLLAVAEEEFTVALPTLMFNLWGVKVPTVARSQKIARYSAGLERIAETRLNDALQVAALGSISTGGDVALGLSSLANAPMLRLQLHKTADFALSSMSQAGLYDAGLSLGRRKTSIPVMDDKTTDLCATRMAYQERAWDEMFVDPLSGAAWLFPPYVYNGLPPKEAWHPCRSSIAIV